ncbi:unnamed protein product [Rhodiola kirilowii]
MLQHVSSNGAPFSCKPLSIGSSNSSTLLSVWSPLVVAASERRIRSVEVKAAESEGEMESSSSLMQTLTLGSWFGLWYLFNIDNKQVLKVFPTPVTITLIQFAVGTVLVLFMWGSNLQEA